jgi:putative membrane protein
MKKERIWLAVVWILYTVGVFGMATPWSALFQSLTPIVLLLTAVGIYQWLPGRPFWILFGPIWAMGWLVEWVGVHTGLIFGQYHYLNNLGLQVLQVPLLIGVNWFILTMGSVAWARTMGWTKPVRIIVAALSMTALDFWIEQVATSLGYWAWVEHPLPGVHNYIGWFITALVTTWWAESFWKSNENIRPLRTVYFIQWMFFLALNLMYATGVMA